MKIEMTKEMQITVASVAIGLAIFLYNILYVNMPTLNIIAITFVAIGPVLMEYRKYAKIKDIEARFPDFLRDVAQNINSGMTLPQAIKSTRSTDYGSLNPYVRKMTSQMDWSIPFSEIFSSLNSIQSVSIKRSVATIIEAHEGGGKISELLRAVGKNISEVNKIRKERYSAIYSEVIIGYTVFFVFLSVIISLKTFLIPSLSIMSSPESAQSSDIVGMYSNIFQWLILIEGFFSGLVIGKMSEGSLIAGLKHCLILVLVGYSVFTLFV